MRQLQKTDIDQNTKKVEILEDGVSIITVAPPSIWAFKNNLISELEEALAKLNKSALTSDEKNQLTTWINGV